MTACTSITNIAAASISTSTSTSLPIAATMSMFESKNQIKNPDTKNLSAMADHFLDIAFPKIDIFKIREEHNLIPH
jgi:hypothetical protein